jgi:uncharacterized protein|eukprot:COSAG06_NODE_4238_length_4442_cov_1.835367_2_plen_935_part_00
MPRQAVDPRHALTQSFNGILIRPPTTSNPAAARRGAPAGRPGSQKASAQAARRPVLTTPNGGDPAAVYATLRGHKPPPQRQEQHQQHQHEQQQGRPGSSESRWGALGTGESGELSGWAEDAPAGSEPGSVQSERQQQGRAAARRSPMPGKGKAVCDPIWTSGTTRDVARRLPEIDQTVLGFETSESRRLLLLGWEEMLRQEAKLGNAEAVEALLFEKMFDINGVDEVGVSALHIAAFQGHDTVTAVLCAHSCDVNLRCRGETALSLAVAADRTGTVDLLLARGADPNITGMGGTTLLHSCAETGNATLAETLVVDYGMPFDKFNDAGLLPFHVAVKEGQSSVAEVLVANGQNVNAWGGGLTAMHLLAMTGDAVAGYRYVKQYGLDPNTVLKPEAEQTSQGRLEPGMRAIHVAILEDNFETVQMLARVGADLLAPDSSGKLPMELAKLNGKRDIANVIREGLAREQLLREVELEMKSLPDDFFQASDKLAAKMDAQAVREAENVDAGRPLNRSCVVCNSVTKDSAACTYCGLVWYCGRAHSQSHREVHRRDCRDCATAQKDRAFELELSTLLGGGDDGSGSPRGRAGVLAAFEYNAPAPVSAVAALSDWDFFFEKRGLPPAWAQPDAVRKKPGGAARETLGGAELPYEPDELEEMLTRASTAVLSLPLTILRALQAVDFDRNKHVEIHILTERPVDTAELHRQCGQLALLLPAVPTMHVVLVKATAQVDFGANLAGGKSALKPGSGPRSSGSNQRQEPQRDHSLNFVNLSPGRDNDGQHSGGGGGGGPSDGSSPKAGGRQTKTQAASGARKGPGVDKVDFKQFEGLYDDYVFSAGRSYVPPTLVVGQHLGLPRQQVPAIVSMLQKEAPILLTFWTQAEHDMIAMAMTDNLKARVVEKGVNPFASLLGLVDTEDVCAYFDSKYAITLRGFAGDDVV